MLLLVLTGFIFFEIVTVIHSGILLVAIAIILLSFGIVYHTFESMG